MYLHSEMIYGVRLFVGFTLIENLKQLTIRQRTKVSRTKLPQNIMARVTRRG